MIAVKVGSSAWNSKSKGGHRRWIAEKLPGAIDALVKALRAGEPRWPIGTIKQITEGQYVQAKCLESSEDFDFLGIGALRASRPLSVIR